jgi:hypothetical protein
MKLRLEIEPKGGEALAALVTTFTEHPFIVSRRARNIRGARKRADRAESWEAVLGARLTSQPKSGPETAANRCIAADPFPLRLVDGDLAPDVEVLARGRIGASWRIRFGVRSSPRSSGRACAGFAVEPGRRSSGRSTGSSDRTAPGSSVGRLTPSTRR